jgi:uncharacterized protein with NRDE domain
MCIVIVSTLHPDYPFILVNNRDEYIGRPTDTANWWPKPDDNVLGGRDLYRPEHGTWLGLTRQGRLACLTNFRETTASFVGYKSRGAMVNGYLRIPSDSQEQTIDTAQRLVKDDLSSYGGFSLIFGLLKRPPWGEQSVNLPVSNWEGMAIVSNRSKVADDVKWLGLTSGETHALSNTHYDDTTWPKVTTAERMVAAAISASVSSKDSVDDLTTKLLDILSHDTLPRRKDGEEWNAYLGQLKNSIFVPPLGKDQDKLQTYTQTSRNPLPNGTSDTPVPVDSATGGLYGTQKQTVILVDWAGHVRYFERSRFDHAGSPLPPGQGDRLFEFDIENW